MGNEDADGIAKEATMEAKDERIKVSVRDWRSLVKEVMWQKTKSMIEREGAYKGVKYFSSRYSKDKRKPWFARINLPRGLVNMVNTLRSDHYNLNESLSRKNYIDNPRCECGAER